MKRNRIKLSSIFKRPHFDITECNSELSYNFYSRRSLVVQFSDLELSCDAGILLARQAEETVQVCRRLSECIEEWRAPNKITHSLYQLVSQRVYQLVGGYEDANDSNQLRHDPSYHTNLNSIQGR